MNRDRSLASNASALLICGLLAGLIVAAAAFPALAVAGLTAKASADGFENLPDELAEPVTPQTSWVYTKDGTLITSFFDESRKHVDLEDIAPVMIDAIIAAEDSRFYEHNGVDLFGVIRAAVANQTSSSIEQGASTLTMQYVRQALIYNAVTKVDVLEATEETPGRKIREMRYAVAVEKELSKDEILERYLNLVYLGNQSYGVHAAAQAYFNTAPDELTLEQAAMLAALPKAPSTLNPTLEDEQAQTDAKDRRNYVLDQMVRTGAITAAEGREAKKSDVELDPQTQPNKCASVPSNKLDWGFFCDYFVQWWSENEAFGETAEERLALLSRGGYTIVTSLEDDLQAKAQNHVTSRLGKKNSLALGTVTLNPTTGHVRAMALNRDYKLDQSKNGPSSDPRARAQGRKGSYPNTTVPLLTGASLGSPAGAGFQVGSTFKLVTMVAALEEGIPLNLTLKNKSPYPSKKYYAGSSPGPSTCGKMRDGLYVWCPKNDNSSMDITANMWNAFGRSINTYFVQLIEMVGAPKVVEMAEKLGIKWRSYSDRDFSEAGCQEYPDLPEDEWPCLEPERWGALTLGVADSTAMDMATVFGTVANDGKRCNPLPVVSITAPDGSELDAANPDCEQVISKDVARAASDAMRCPVANRSFYDKCESGTYSQARDIVGKPIAGKTGTTDSNQASWFVVTAPNATSAGFIGDPDYREVSVPGHLLNTPHEAASYTLRDALKGEKTVDFKKPDPALANGKNLVDVPGMDCVSPEEAENRLRNAGFEPNRVEGEKSRCAKGKVYGTSPTGALPKGSSVDYFISTGKEKKNEDDRVPTVNSMGPVLLDEAPPTTIPVDPGQATPPGDVPPGDLPPPGLHRWQT
ncbi:membrane peptidoglycan carboxypeptidase [Stackebrandtia endophytica]|uniref:Membrane peptidoglycan carboxypeptidase n=1 Tax=Stackebrandtia endophytica TaxID=1496996 RepID=A0A543AVD4_9ACTN|nr:transglycosylase domain-containing protein [Stackebrandtia endophytica]TQL76537.1 membrane peptidoglycan carboxypeptidase [Stackebrandtia endophytica]